MNRVYFRSRTDDGGLAAEGLPALGDYAAVFLRSEFVEVLRPEGKAQSDVVTIRRGSMTSVPAMPAFRNTDTRRHAGTYPLSIRADLLAGSTATAGAAS